MENVRYYISTGELNAMYTLRMLADDKIYMNIGDGKHESIPVLRDWYICNLSTDIDKANKKALERISGDGPLISGAEAIGDLNAYRESQATLRAEEQARIEEERLIAEEKARVARNDKLLAKISAGEMPWGRWSGCKLEEIDRAYLKFWLAQETSETNGDAVLMALQAAILARYPQMENLPEANGGWLDEDIKERTTDKCTLIDVIPFDNQWGGGWIHKYVTNEGKSLTWFASKGPKGYDVGDTVRLSFTVKSKEYDRYNGDIETTIINRARLAKR